jgi:hypothetical protein
MKTVKRILLGVAALIVLVLVVAMFAPSEYVVERSTEINRPKHEVFDYVKHLRNQDKYSVWSMADPNVKTSTRGEDGTVGFVASWESQQKNVGQGEQEITAIEEGQRVETQLRFKKPWEGEAKAEFMTEEADKDKTKVRWSFNSRMPYPMNIMLLFMSVDNMLGKDLQQGLDNMKKNLENGA